MSNKRLTKARCASSSDFELATGTRLRVGAGRSSRLVLMNFSRNISGGIAPTTVFRKDMSMDVDQGDVMCGGVDVRGSKARPRRRVRRWAKSGT